MKLSSRTIILFETLCLLGFIAARANPSENNDEIRACPDGLQRVHRGCYMFVEDELNWQDAANYCKENNGELSTIQSFNEKEELQKYVNTNYPDTGKWWIGLTKNKTLQNEWTWLDGHPLDGNVLPWLNSLQKVKPGIVCGYADSASKRLLAAVVTCKTEQSFICEYHSITPRPIQDSAFEATTFTPFVSETTPRPTVQNTTKTIDNCPCRDSTFSSDSISSHDERLKRRNQELTTDEELYKKYLQSEINANNAKVVYYSQVAKLYQDALLVQNQFYTKEQAKLDLEITHLQQGSKCN
uniref:C-type lectin domain-containing protein n=1 Tax=Arion vulgaris TaxID=1028688 RepID=A0A0B6ZQL8_9EUPU